MKYITHQRLKELLRYEAETGKFYWLVDRGWKSKSGMSVGNPASGGYLRIRLDGFDYLAHRLVWFYVNGVWPAHEIDHRNGMRDDNRIVNLREATCGENKQNRTVSKNNTSGFPGVTWKKRERKWVAQIGLNYKHIHLGRFDTADQAALAYIEAKAKYHQFHSTVRK